MLIRTHAPTPFWLTHGSLWGHLSVVALQALDAADIPFTVPTAAMFVWLDLRKFLPRNPTFEDESALLAHVMSTAKCVLTPGSWRQCSIAALCSLFRVPQPAFRGWLDV